MTQRKKKPETITSIDGRQYTPEFEDELNRLAIATFSSDSGKTFLAYLTGITQNHIHPAGTATEALHHFEGQRWVVGLMKARIEKGKAK